MSCVLILAGHSAWAQLSITPNQVLAGQPYTLNFSGGSGYYYIQEQGSGTQYPPGASVTKTVAGVYTYTAYSCGTSGCVASGAAQSVNVTGTYVPSSTPTPTPLVNIKLSESNYDVYIGYGNSDSHHDVYLHGADRFVLLHGDIITPIQVDPNLSIQFNASVSAPSGFSCPSGATSCSPIMSIGIERDGFVVSPAYDADEIDLKGLVRQVENRHYFFGDFDGNGVSDLLVLMNNVGTGWPTPRFILINGGAAPSFTPFATQVAIPDSLVNFYNIFGAAAAFAVRDSNGDGRAELVFMPGGGYSDIHLNFSLASSDALSVQMSYEPMPAAKPATFMAPTAAEFRVSESGAATYNVPINLPQGTAGVTPSVSLSYSSQSGNGIAGIGWSLNAVSGISRCRQTLEDEGVAKPLTFTSEDRFCLDGQKLMLVDPALTYGNPGTVYRTKIDNYAYIQALGGIAGDPDYFRVISKDGSVRYYGKNADAKLQINSRTYQWNISSSADSVNNVIEYEYTGSMGEHRLSEIRYAESAAGFHSKVLFRYKTRPDIQRAYLFNQQMVTTQRLASIEVYNSSTVLPAGTPAEENLLRTYELAYLGTKQSDDKSRLGRIQECAGISGGNGTNCLPPLSFEWEYQDVGISSTASLSQEVISWDMVEKCVTYLRPSNQREWQTFERCSLVPDNKTILGEFKTADINGDGCGDLIYSYYDNDYKSYSVAYRVSANNCSNLVPGIFRFSDLGIGLKGEDLEVLRTEFGIADARFEIIDFNTDGRPDLAVRVKGGTTDRWDIYLASPQLGGEYALNSIAIESGSVKTSVSVWVNPVVGGEVLIDTNSDGLVDLVSSKNSVVDIAYGRRNSNAADTFAARYDFGAKQRLSGTLGSLRPLNTMCPGLAAPYSIISSQSNLLHGGFVGDFDGDGKSEIVASTVVNYLCSSTTDDEYEHYENGISIYRIENNALVPYFYLENVHSARDVLPVDINGDGLTDLIVKAGGSRKVLLSAGLGANGFGTFVETQIFDTSVRIDFDSTNMPQLVDLNQDGFVDLVWHDKFNRSLMAYHWDSLTNKFLPPEMLKSGVGDKDAFALTDFDGNGFTDLVTFSGAYDTDANNKTLSIYSDVVGSKLQNLITRFDNGLGSVTDLHYEKMSTSTHYISNGGEVARRGFNCLYGLPCDGVLSSAAVYSIINNPWNLDPIDPDWHKPVFELSTPMSIVTRVESTSPSNDGVADNNRVAIEYHYKEARAQAGGRGFLGFRYLVTEDQQTGVITRTRYAQRYPFTGMPELTETRTAEGYLLSRSENFNSDNAPNTATTPAAQRYHQPYVSKTIEQSYALNETWVNGQASRQPGALLSTTTTEQTQDAYGNVLTMSVLTESSANSDGSIVGFSESKTTTNAYGSQVLSLHEVSLSYAQLGRLTSSTVSGSRNNVSLPVRTSTFTYHNVGGSLTRQNETVYQHVGLLKSETLDPSSTDPAVVQSESLVTEYHYDAFGNKALIESTGWDGQANVTRFSFTYYDATGRYVDSSKNAMGHASEAVTLRNSRTGAVEESQSAQGVITTNEYDLLGRLLSTSNNLGTNVSAQTEYLSCAQLVSPLCPAGTQFVERTSSSDGSTSVVYKDVLGRTIRSAKLNFDGNWVQSDTEYNLRGQTVALSEPYAYTLASNAEKRWTRTQYDLLGRPIAIDAPGEGDASIRYVNQKTVFTNALGQVKTEWKNPAGQLVRVEDELETRIEYAYDLHGNLSRVEVIPKSGASSVTTIQHDALGRKKSMTDPDKGAWTYKYNAFGELVEQTDGKNQLVTNDYDILGRVTKRVDYKNVNKAEVEGATWWYYDGKTDTNSTVNVNALGAASAVVYTRSASNGRCDSASTQAKKCTYTQFDNLGRVSASVTHIDSDNNTATAREVFTSSVIYDPTFGRVYERIDPLTGKVNLGTNVRSGTRDIYNSHGYLQRTEDLASGTVLYETVAVNARGQVTDARLNDSISQKFYYNNETGALEKQIGYVGGLTAINPSTPDGFTVQFIEYRWDAVGNLLSRSNRSSRGGTLLDLHESYCYDRLNRLIKRNAGITSACSNLQESAQDTRFDARGNITYKVDVGTYTYGQSVNNQILRPHAVASTSDGRSYFYDNNGNMTEDRLNGVTDRRFEYSTYDMLTRITKGSKTAVFDYGADRTRYIQIETDSANAANNKTTVYLDGVERIFRPSDGTYEWQRFVGAGIRSYTTTKSGETFNRLGDVDIRIMLKDHLGSVDVVLGATGTVRQSMSFGSWGQRRVATTWNGFNTAQLLGFDSSQTSRGFTGHEMLDEFGVIHMNGRIYDARLARFLQADPHIDGVTNTQGYNRYSYLHNNPLNATDPTGFLKLKEVFGAVVGVMLVVATGGTASPFLASWYGAAALGAITGAVGAAVNGGNILKGALFGAVSAAAFYGVGQYFQGLGVGGAGCRMGTYNFGGNYLTAGEITAQIFAHGAVGGVMSVVQGGKFGHGFVAAGVTKAFTNMQVAAAETHIAAGAFVAAMVGGTVSELTGGKFANGANTAAFQFLLNAMGEKAKQNGGARRLAARRAAAARGSTEMPDLASGRYPVIVDSISVSFGVGAAEAGDLFVVDRANQQVLHFKYTAGGGSLGLPGVVVSREFGEIYIDNVSDILGIGLVDSGNLVLGVGNNSSVATSQNLNTRSLSSGFAVGFGGGGAAMISNTTFSKVYSFDEAPGHLPLSGF